jgi:hypothetical protein
MIFLPLSLFPFVKVNIHTNYDSSVLKKCESKIKLLTISYGYDENLKGAFLKSEEKAGERRKFDISGVGSMVYYG